MAVTNNFTVDEFIDHVKVSGILTEEGREYIDVRDVRLIIDMINAKHKSKVKDGISASIIDVLPEDRELVATRQL